MSKDSVSEKSIRTVCTECHANCNILVYVRNGKVNQIEGDPEYIKPGSAFCEKASIALERLYHPDRLLFPLKRTGGRGEGKWQRISWGEALETICTKFSEIKKRFGAEYIALIKGHYDRHCDFVSRLGNAFGTPNIASIDNSCYIPSASGRLLTYGFDGRPDYAGSPDCVMCWGTSASPNLKHGAKLIVIDSIRTKTAQKANLWLQPRPSSDLALALGIVHIIINEELYDKAFVETWTTGFERLKAHIQSYSPDKVAQITWVPAEKIIEAARLFTQYEHACLHTGNAGDDVFHSTQFARAASIIQSICGLLDIPGGTVQAIPGAIDREGTAADILQDMLPAEQSAKKLGVEYCHFKAHPLWDTIVNKPAELQPQYLVKSILEKSPYEIQAAFCMGSNPVLTWSNSKKVFKAFSEINFLAVADFFMTPTAMLADIVLPVATTLETDAVVVGSLGVGDTSLQAQQQVVQVGECRSNLSIIISMAERLGLGKYFWKSSRAYLNQYMARIGMTFDELCRRPCVVSSGATYRKYLKTGFNTPSGKVELFSTLCEKWGYDPLPVYYETKQLRTGSSELDQQFPLILTSAHNKNFNHSQGRNIKQLRDIQTFPNTTLHPKTAEDLGVKEGDQVRIENEQGSIVQTATISDKVDPRVVAVDYGWWFPEMGESKQFGWDLANVNILTDDEPPYSPEIGSPMMRGFFCRVTKSGE
jgi:anaerobic selenocysteine-containing dehydrogenase